MQQQVSILQGDALEMLRTLPDESVQCVVTSPPYYGLRDYGTAEWDGGEDGCDHMRALIPTSADDPGRRCSTINDTRGSGTMAAASARSFRDECGKCGATRIDSQIGLESSPTEYITKLVDVFREVRRVLRKDGVAWVNMGDSYSNGSSNPSPKHVSPNVGVSRTSADTGVQPKNLLGMPWRLAFALQADGWYLRQDIIWAKPNPMPESVTDRCTKAHEYVFLLSKSERYYYDAAAIQEEASGRSAGNSGDVKGAGVDDPFFRTREGFAAVSEKEWFRRNKRSVWTLTTEPYPEAHFATFPTELPRICILAGTRVGDTVLDPFAGSGTTLQVALELSRQAIGIELNADYVALANRRLSQTTLGLPLEIAA